MSVIRYRHPTQPKASCRKERHWISLTIVGHTESIFNMIGIFGFYLLKLWYQISRIYFTIEYQSSTHPINQNLSYDRYAEMTHFVNHTTTKSRSKYSMESKYRLCRPTVEVLAHRNSYQIWVIRKGRLLFSSYVDAIWTHGGLLIIWGAKKS